MPIKTRKQREREAALAEQEAQRAEEAKEAKLVATIQMLDSQITARQQSILALQRQRDDLRSRAQAAVSAGNRTLGKHLLMQSKDKEKQISAGETLLTNFRTNRANAEQALDLLRASKVMTAATDALKGANVEGLSDQIQTAQMDVSEATMQLNQAFETMGVAASAENDELDAELDQMAAMAADEQAVGMMIPGAADPLDAELDAMAAAAPAGPQSEQAREARKKKMADFL